MLLLDHLLVLDCHVRDFHCLYELLLSFFCCNARRFAFLHVFQEELCLGYCCFSSVKPRTDLALNFLVDGFRH